MENETTEKRAPRQRSWFWPIVLITIGVIWLLRNFDILGNSNIAMLFRLWPLLLIAIGLDLIFTRLSIRLGTYLSLGTAALAVVLMILGPALGWGKMDLKHAAYNEPLGSATTAQIKLDLGTGTTNVNPATDARTLFAADVTYAGELKYTVSGSDIKTIHLGQESSNVNFGLNWPSDTNMSWNIQLNKDIPLAMNVNSGVGDAFFNIEDLQITSMNINAGVGRLNLKLPALKSTYRIDLNSGVGATEINFKPDTAADLFINGGVGSVVIYVPEQAAVRVEKTNSVGGVNLPSKFVAATSPTGESQNAWETPNYRSSERRITIMFTGGVGALTVRT